MKRSFAFFLMAGILLTGLPTTRAAGAEHFTDVSPDAWYGEAVGYAVDKGLFEGTGENTFSPQSTMTRAMFVTVLGRHAGAKTVAAGVGVVTASSVNLREGPGTDSSIVCVLDAGAPLAVLSLADGWFQVRAEGGTGYIRQDLMSASDSEYTDVPYGSWYSGYVRWAGNTGVAVGTGTNSFSPARDITRAEICAMLHNYMTLLDGALPAEAEPAAFPDAGDIAAIETMHRAGIINGYEDGSFRPGASATRAEVATILMRFFQKLELPPAGEPANNTGGLFDFSVVPGSTLAESGAVSDGYFDDACFIGHSIVVGMKTFFGLKNADFHAVSGIAASALLRYEGFPLQATRKDIYGNTVPETGTIEDVLLEKSYGKVYIMLGTNELGDESYHREAYYDAMTGLVELVLRTQPRAAVYLLSITPVTRELSETEKTFFTRENVVAFNRTLHGIAVEQGVHYLDLFTLLADAEGYLPAENGAYDGIHILASEYDTIMGFLRTHTA